jgi:hypothetical protein
MAMMSFGRRGAGGGTRLTSTLVTSVFTACQ